MFISQSKRNLIEKKKIKSSENISEALQQMNSTIETEILDSLLVLEDNGVYFTPMNMEDYVNNFEPLYQSKNMKIVEKSLEVIGSFFEISTEETLTKLTNLFLKTESFILKNHKITVLVLQIFTRRFRQYPKLMRKMLPFFSKTPNEPDINRELVYIFEDYLDYYDEINHFLNSECYGFFFNDKTQRLVASSKITESLITGNQITRKMINENKNKYINSKKKKSSRTINLHSFCFQL